MVGHGSRVGTGYHCTGAPRLTPQEHTLVLQATWPGANTVRTDSSLQATWPGADTVRTDSSLQATWQGANTVRTDSSPTVYLARG